MVKRIIKNITNIMLYGFTCIMILLVILSFLGFKPYITISGSMEPNIKTGIVCFVNLNSKYEEAEVDDIIAFKVNDILVTHRVLNITENGIETKGDNNEDPDSIITTNNNFVGKTLFSIPYIGYIIMFFRQPVGLSIIAGVLLILLFLNIKDVLQTKKTEVALNKPTTSSQL